MGKDKRTYESRKTEVIQCVICDKTKYVTKQKLKNGAKYCSLQCAGIAKKGTQRTPEVYKKMSKTFFKKGQRVSVNTEFKRGQASGHRFQKGQVAWNDSGTILICPECQQEFKCKPSRKRKPLVNVFCSKKCANKFSYRGGPLAARLELRDAYVRKAILSCRSGGMFERKDITYEMIGLKRQALIMHRTFKKFIKWRERNGNTDHGDV